MMVLAKTVEGQEYLYRASTAHKVSKRNAETIRDLLNKIKYDLKAGEVWFIHEVGRYDAASEYAEYQSFTLRNGALRERRL